VTKKDEWIRNVGGLILGRTENRVKNLIFISRKSRRTEEVFGLVDNMFIQIHREHRN
jgi:hypothetical protein